MKKSILYLLIVLFALPFATEAKVWRVNNNAGVSTDFIDLDDAMNGYDAGDTLHLEPSATVYHWSNNLSNFVGKFVTIIGNGYLHFAGDGLQQDIRESKIISSGSIYVNSKIKFIGIVFVNPVVLVKREGPIQVGDVYFESCFLTNGIEYSDATNFGSNQINGLHLSKNYIPGNIYITLPADPGNFLYNFSFENNIMLGSFAISPVPLNHDPIVIRNNVFAGNYECNQAYCANNIFIANISTGFNGSILKNNIFTGPAFTTNANTEVNNQFNVDISTVLNLNPAFFDRAYDIKVGSVAVGAGIPNGATPVDCGAYGGPNPYKPNGMPAIPSISELSVPPSVINGTDMNIGVKSKSNN